MGPQADEDRPANESIVCMAISSEMVAHRIPPCRFSALLTTPAAGSVAPKEVALDVKLAKWATFTSYVWFFTSVTFGERGRSGYVEAEMDSMKQFDPWVSKAISGTGDPWHENTRWTRSMMLTIVPPVALTPNNDTSKQTAASHTTENSVWFCPLRHLFLDLIYHSRMTLPHCLIIVRWRQDPIQTPLSVPCPADRALISCCKCLRIRVLRNTRARGVQRVLVHSAVHDDMRALRAEEGVRARVDACREEDRALHAERMCSARRGESCVPAGGADDVRTGTACGDLALDEVGDTARLEGMAGLYGLCGSRRS